MKKKLVAVLKYLLILAIGIGMLILAFRGVSVSETIETIKKAKFLWLFLSVLASLVAFFSRALRWRMLIESLGLKVSKSNTTAALMIGYLGNLAFPRLGEVTRCGSLSTTQKVPFDSLLGTVIVERLLDVLCLFLCLVLVAYLEYERLGNFLFEKIYLPGTTKFKIIFEFPVLTSVIAVILILLIILFFRKRKKSNGESGLFKIIKGIMSGIDAIRKLKRPFAFLFHTALIWGMYFLMSYLCFFALPETDLLNWKAGLFVLVAGGMGMSAPIPGGVGSYHWLVREGLLLYGISAQGGAAFATLMHGSQTLVVILLGAISYLYLSLKKKNAATENNRYYPAKDRGPERSGT